MGINECLTATNCNGGATGKQRECNAADRACSAVSFFFLDLWALVFESKIDVQTRWEVHDNLHPCGYFPIIDIITLGVIKSTITQEFAGNSRIYNI